jgi:hypothetical protein
LNNDHPSCPENLISLVSDPLLITKMASVGTSAPDDGVIYKFQVPEHPTVIFNRVLHLFSFSF